MSSVESLSGLNAFVKAAQLGSFVAAADRLGVSASAIGKSVARLEASLGVSLLNRSTRSLSLTEEGLLFFERSQRIVAELEEAEEELSRLMAAPRGRLRLSFPAIGYRLLLPLLPGFTARYPEIELDLDFNDRLVDVIGEGYDAVLRSGEFADSRLKARRMGGFRFRIVGATGYFRQHGIPQTPADLAQHACLLYRFSGSGQIQPWQFDTSHQARPLSLTGPLVFNNLEAQISAARRGLGVIYVPDFAVKEYLEKGELRSVLDEQISAGGQFSLLWPGNRHLLPKLRVLIDYLAEHIELSK
ncbi:LysR family transcriptional regulator [Erwinia sorbitola]|uniref:LysR family transcriptional regulator n=1 Tax=Erwinia sorbitola TaxID=2681984 RepID=A0A6I6F073_9GAMM|nr:LysR family transcriptional regulator [Erwinia sorbitola]MTD26175.1 LysR family transcriptional regulator [Erwinia sorbitola]QGU87290.1 LysR family transcriptional regulator [Erwinia sorbitola]